MHEALQLGIENTKSILVILCSSYHSWQRFLPTGSVNSSALKFAFAVFVINDLLLGENNIFPLITWRRSVSTYLYDNRKKNMIEVSREKVILEHVTIAERLPFSRFLYRMYKRCIIIHVLNKKLPLCIQATYSYTTMAINWLRLL